jgi:UPF0755 protein
VRQREHESVTDSDPHTLLFGADDDPETEQEEDGLGTGPARAGRRSTHRAAPAGRRGGQHVMTLLSVLVIVLLAVSAWIIVPRVVGMLRPADYSGTGSGSVTIQVSAGDSASDIGATLQHAGVVKSAKAFADAAANNSAAANIQPGNYVLRSHMSGKSALQLILDPSSRNTAGDVVVTEGATSLDVAKKLVQSLGNDKQAEVAKAIADVSALGIPLGYTNGSAAPASVEGFLYPATYTVDPKGSAASALQLMTSRFAEHDRATGFAAGAQALGLSPYQALIIASIAQSEAKYPDDMAKVARVILNRIAAQRPLQIDATSVYAAKLQGLDPTKVQYAQIDSPYNTYQHAGLPPTPISSPGADAMNAAVHPPQGGWMFYVNSDAQGHLLFTDDEAVFAAAAAKCEANNWGCG